MASSTLFSGKAAHCEPRPMKDVKDEIREGLGVKVSRTLAVKKEERIEINALQPTHEEITREGHKVQRLVIGHRTEEGDDGNDIQGNLIQTRFGEQVLISDDLKETEVDHNEMEHTNPTAHEPPSDETLEENTSYFASPKLVPKPPSMVNTEWQEFLLSPARSEVASSITTLKRKRTPSDHGDVTSYEQVLFSDNQNPHPAGTGDQLVSHNDDVGSSHSNEHEVASTTDTITRTHEEHPETSSPTEYPIQEKNSFDEMLGLQNSNPSEWFSDLMNSLTRDNNYLDRLKAKSMSKRLSDKSDIGKKEQDRNLIVEEHVDEKNGVVQVVEDSDDEAVVTSNERVVYDRRENHNVPNHTSNAGFMDESREDGTTINMQDQTRQTINPPSSIPASPFPINSTTSFKPAREMKTPFMPLSPFIVPHSAPSTEYGGSPLVRTSVRPRQNVMRVEMIDRWKSGSPVFNTDLEHGTTELLKNHEAEGGDTKELRNRDVMDAFHSRIQALEKTTKELVETTRELKEQMRALMGSGKE